MRALLLKTLAAGAVAMSLLGSAAHAAPPCELNPEEWYDEGSLGYEVPPGKVANLDIYPRPQEYRSEDLDTVIELLIVIAALDVEDAPGTILLQDALEDELGL